MIFIPNIEKPVPGGIGGKANNLLQLVKMGAQVPAWAVIPQEVLLTQLSGQTSKKSIKAEFEQLNVPQEILANLQSCFGDNYADKTYAVRSSAIDEDGSQFSFAGQFETFLHVSFDQLSDKIKAIWKSVVSDRVITYREENNLPLQLGIGVIVQEMVAAEVAGVAFGMNPVSGDKESKVISAVYGLGEGLVSGELDADTFTLSPKGTDTQLAHKTHALLRKSAGNGVEKVALEADKSDTATLQENELKEIAALLDRLDEHLGTPQDIEFAYANSQLYLLQTRPITAAGSQPKGEYILWDNSNIIESYPGITTPLTFSFIIKMYEMVYRQFVGIMGVTEKDINRHSGVFANTLGLVRGRVYYNLLNWYKMLAMLPGYSINAENMERMMGVKERFELEDDFGMSKGRARWRMAAMGVKMIQKQIALPRERRKFLSQLKTIMAEYDAIDFEALTPEQIIAHYNKFESSLLMRWKAPLINDFFAMIWFGMLEKQAIKYCPDQPNIHNDLLCGSQDIISVEPIHRSIAIAALVSENEAAKALFIDNTPDKIWAELCKGTFPAIQQKLEEYIQLFGNRCVGELKLETVSYAQKPALFVKVIKSYVAQGITQKRSESNIEEELRENAEKKVFGTLKGKGIKRWWFKYVLNKARDLVSNRENLRYERTKGFGMVRRMFSALGNKLHQVGHLQDPRDVFYLELAEIKALEKAPFSKNLKENIAARKEEFAAYKTQKPPQERFFTYGHHFTDEYIYSLEKIEDAEQDLHGIGCCPGIVQAKVRVVMDPNEIDSLNGDILVTSSTDPGWVTLFPTASAIIVERGSLLSHSAIVSREMGIPCIVSVTGLLRTLKSGDEVLMDGSTGKIKIITQ